MKSDFLHYISANNLFLPDSKIILAVSGGVDSVVMSDLFYNTGYKCCIAHCNFGLRGRESDEDAIFVKNLAEKYDFPFFVKRFETEKYAKDNGASIQMAARQLRYRWFDELLQKTAYDYIAIAHNKNDVIETFFLNLSRGTGIKGLTGIKNKYGNIVRPVLFAGRQTIADYAKNNNISFREDSGNKLLKYSRNRIRNIVLPELKKINPSIETTIYETITRLKDARQVLNNDLEEKKKFVISFQNNTTFINIKRLKQLTPLNYYLFEFIYPFGFNASDVKDIISVLDKQSGKIFYSQDYTIVKDRQYLIVEKNTTYNNKSYIIDKCTTVVDKEIRLKITQLKIDKRFEISKNKNIAQIDASKIEYPLVLRRWKKGDKFIPLGMTKFKKLSDFLTNNKLSVIEKQNVWVVENKKDIVWIAGMRIDDRYKISGETKNIIIIEKI